MNERRIRKYMQKELEMDAHRFDIYSCGEVNSTLLAEDAAQALSLYDGDDIPEYVFEIALEVSERRDWLIRSTL